MAAGNVIFANLAILFAVGIAVGLASSDKGTAGLSAVLALLVMNSTINAMLKITGTLAKDILFMFFVWPHLQQLIFGIGGLVESTGYVGTLIYGFVLRILGLFDLHHIFYLPF